MSEETKIKANDGFRMIRRSSTGKVHIFSGDRRLCQLAFKNSSSVYIIPVDTCNLSELCGNCAKKKDAYTVIAAHIAAMPEGHRIMEEGEEITKECICWAYGVGPYEGVKPCSYGTEVSVMSAYHCCPVDSQNTDEISDKEPRGIDSCHLCNGYSGAQDLSYVCQTCREEEEDRLKARIVDLEEQLGEYDDLVKLNDFHIDKVKETKIRLREVKTDRLALREEVNNLRNQKIELQADLNEHERVVERVAHLKTKLPEDVAAQNNLIHNTMMNTEDDNEFISWYMDFVAKKRAGYVEELTGMCVDQIKDMKEERDRLKVECEKADASDLSSTAKAAIAAIKEMDKVQYQEYCYAVGTEDQLDNRKWWKRQPIIHETLLNQAGPMEALQRMDRLKRYGLSQAFLLVPIDVKAIMEA